MTTIEHLENIVKETKTMRNLQKEYFKTRDKQVLERSKIQEKKIDAMIDHYYNPKLF